MMISGGVVMILPLFHKKQLTNQKGQNIIQLIS